jgi:signal transduction histidine kinase
MIRHPTVPSLWPAVIAAFFAALSVCPSLSAEERSPRNVLTVHSGSEFFPPNPVLDAAIREVLFSSDELRIDYFTEYLESDRFGAPASPALADYIRQKYRGRHIDLVIAITNDSLQFVLDQRGDLFPDAPIVFAGITAPDERVRRAGQGLAMVRVGSAYAETVKLALELHPSTERVFVVAGSPNQQDVDSVRAQLSGFSRQVQLTYVNEDTLSRALEVIRAVPPGSLVLHIWHRWSEQNDRADPLEAARLVARAATVPVYGTVDLNIGTGIVGGVVRGTRQTGTRVGQMALQILQGARAQDIPVEDAQLVAIFDWRQLKRWGIDPSRLPPGSNIQFFTPTTWEANRPYIIATMVVVAAQLLAIAGLLLQRAKRRRAEAMVLAREATIRTSYERIRQLAGRLINVQEAARADIARDLHDGVCQELAGVSIAVGGLKHSSGSVQDAPTQQVLSKIQSETLRVFEGLRRLSHSLHPATLRLLGLTTAMRAHCVEVEKRHGVEVTFTADGDFGDLHADVAASFFRIAQESLQNGVVHGGARRLTVSLVRSGDQIELTVSDDGGGFDLEAVRRNGSGLGLVSIEERAHLLGGDVEITTGPRRGTIVRVRSPAGAHLAI